MSQLPTGQTGPVSGVRVRRGAVDDVPRIGIQQGFQPAMVSDLPMVQENDRLAESLARSLGVLDRSLAISAQELENQKREKDREDREAETFERGLGAKRSLEIGPQLLSDVQAGTLTPADGEDAATFARRVIGERAQLPSDASEAFRGEVEDRLIERVQTSMLARKRAVQDASDRELTDLAVAGAAGKGADDLRAAISKVRELNPLASEQAATALVATASMDYAASLGDQAAFDAAASLVPENSPERVKYQTEINRVKAQDEALRVETFRRRISELSIDDTTPIAYIRDQVVRAENIPADVREMELRSLDARAEQTIREQQRLAKEQNEINGVNRAVDLAGMAGRSWHEGGIPALRQTFGDTIPVELEDGTTIDVPTDEAVDRALVLEMNSIAETSLTPREATERRVQYLAGNNEKYAPIEIGFGAGYSAATLMVRQAVDGKPIGPIPAQLTSALDEFDSMYSLGAAGELVANRHIPAESKTFYENYAIARKGGAQGDRNVAVQMAIDAIANGPKPIIKGTITDKSIVSATSWIGDATNASQIRAHVGEQAEMMVKRGLVPSATQAVKLASDAAKRDHKNVDGFMVQDSDGALPPDASQLVNFARGEYTRKYKDEMDALGIEENDLQIVRGTDGRWNMVWLPEGIPLPHFADSRFDPSLTGLRQRFDTQRRIEQAMDIEKGQATERMRQVQGTGFDRFIAGWVDLNDVSGASVRRYRLKKAKQVKPAIDVVKDVMSTHIEMPGEGGSL